jgi:hypothetical protein
MTVISRSIVIPAPAATVWSTLTDTARYGSWNPFIPELTGELQPGAKLRVRIAPPGGWAMAFSPSVTDVVEGRRVEWLGHLGVSNRSARPRRGSPRRNSSSASWCRSSGLCCDEPPPGSTR